MLSRFDDAFENLLENALPVLDEFGIPAVIFVVPGNLGQTPRWSISPGHPEYDERVMTAEQLRQISSRNVVIGSHTQTHPDLSELPAEQIWWELTESKRSLEEMIGRPVEDLALPFGSYNRDVLQMALEAGYKRIYTLDPKPAEPAGEGPVVGRFSMSLDVWRIEFVLTCAGAYAWLYPWWRCIRRVREWRHRSAE
jgi:peptidoglycan/xylan/chitin deacetylase (PgdA/CDA1 family)